MTASATIAARALKIATGELVAAAGGIEAAAGYCRVGKSQVARYMSLNPSDAGHFMPVDIVRCLERLTGQPVVTRVLALEASHELMPHPETIGMAQCWPESIAAVVRESGDVTQALLAAVADGRVCKQDVITHDLERQAEEMATLALQLRARFRFIRENEQ